MPLDFIIENSDKNDTGWPRRLCNVWDDIKMLRCWVLSIGYLINIILVIDEWSLGK